MTGKMHDILTVGHSTYSYEDFLSLLRSAEVTAIADVRSSPYSRQSPHFGREALKSELRLDGISYAYLGDELGGRPKQKHLFVNGVADYERMALEPSFKAGIERVFEGSKKFRIALMCSEHNPMECHRCLLVGRSIADAGLNVRHILSNGKILDQVAVENALLSGLERQSNDLFSNTERLSMAYRKQANKFAFAERSRKLDDPKGSQVSRRIASGHKL
jgi:uncharacterized protein (DUF488 family)